SPRTFFFIFFPSHPPAPSPSSTLSLHDALPIYPIDVLVGLIQAVTSAEPTIPTSMTAAGDGAPLFFAALPRGRRIVLLPKTGQLAGAVVDDVTGVSALSEHPAGDSPAGYRRGFLWRRGALSVLVAPVDQSMTRFDTTAVLDDRADSVSDADAFTEAWQEWLRIANIMPVRSPGTQVELTT